ncbi:MAG TPA: hypothetical protein DCO65_05305 [Spartobacteria bacterium]|jgi:hypothetical protein|nr:hypothetical protein [Spartobacteria bacterium]
MKTLSGKLKYVVPAAVVVLAIFTYRAFAQTSLPEPKTGFVLIIKTRTPLKYGEAHFRDTLSKLKTKLYNFDLLDKNGKHTPIVSGASAKLDIKTDKVTASELAKSAELTLIGVHATQLLSSSSTTDIKSVLGEF